MATLREGTHTGEFLVSEANGTRSRSTGTVLSGQVLVAGELVGIETASGKYVAYNPANAPLGSNVVKGIMFDNVDATGADKAGQVLIVRDAEVRGSDLKYNEAVPGTITVETAGLLALGLVVR
jgi:hypothetical protein